MIDRSKHVKLLTDCIVKAIDGMEFKWDIFFKIWFRDNGNPLFFLFKKNLSVTNTQFVELFSLISLYSTNILDKNIETKLLFYSTEHIKITFTEVITTLLEDYNPKDKSRLIDFSERYIDIFGYTVAVDMFFGSCAVFLPKCVTTDLERIVFDSGYIHSAGKSVFIRNIKKAKKIDFFNSIDSHFKLYPITGEPIPFIVYSHEDFSGYDKESTDLIDKGIEQCKIYVEKMSMGSHRLAAIINDMQIEKYKNILFIPKSGNYQINHNFKQGKTLWLISDRSISGGQIRNPGNNRYYICYEQSLKNDSPYFYFDENKPAWKSHTTLPHSLTSALLNAARPLPKDGIICDPFVGTGTTWLEVKRLQLQNRIYCSDLSPAASILLSDNIRFFSLSSKELITLLEDLKACIRNDVHVGYDQPKLIDDEITYSPYDDVINMLDILKIDQKDEDQEFILTEEFVRKFNQLPFLTRIVFYIGLRAELRFQSGFKRKSFTYDTAFKKSFDKLTEQTQMLIELKNKIESVVDYKIDIQNNSFIKSIATYSFQLTPTFIFLKYADLMKNTEAEVISAMDARNLENSSYDLIICDPPYGFNTTEDGSRLAQLYSEFIDKAITSLRPQGQLILCLPAESFTGRDLSYCTRSDLISRQILVKAHKQGRVVYKPAKSLPLSSLSPPYYWESERALRRTILHFRFL